jgi:serine/threonine-protein kinase HipA
MAMIKTDILVYAHWQGMPEALMMGILSAHQGKGRKSLSFEYDESWLKGKNSLLLDPDILFYSGPQYPGVKDNFGIQD